MTAKTFTQAFDIGSQCDKGRRPNNEDRVLRVEEQKQVTEAQRRALGRLYIVADGVGGNDNGEVASKRVVERLMFHYYEGEHPEGSSYAERFQRAIQATTREIFEESVAANNNMRSTMAAALILDHQGQPDKRQAIIANVGDSPVILFRKGAKPQKLSQDHVKRDQSLSQAMGDAMVNVTIFNQTLQPDDILVICSDGLSDGAKGPVPPSAIEKIVRTMPSQAAADELVRLAKRIGSNDNISAIVIRNGERPLP
ncbi:MAG: protein serine/threonine phosphatase 2C family protein, partial [Chloroflexia bacterium]|nr:protein serine/threonine phosphatase 2C family protein [Chloroflexia bacterium]